MPLLPFPAEAEGEQMERNTSEQVMRNGKQVLLSFSRNDPPHHTCTHYIYAHTVIHTFEEKRNYITHQLFIFTSPIEIIPASTEARGSTQGLRRVAKERPSSPGHRPWNASKFPAQRSTLKVGTKSVLSGASNLYTSSLTLT